MHQCLLSTSRFSVERRVYARPGTSPITREVVVHPGAVVILPILNDGRIVMIRNFRYSVEEELWELPAGTCEPHEPAVDTARRELEEETGYRAGVLTPMIEFHPSPGILTELMRVFMATELTFVDRKLEAGERIEVEIVAADVARRMLIHGEFRDAKTIATLGTYFLSMTQTEPRP